MTKEYSAKAFLQLQGSYSFVDVRSPGEFAAGHMPGCVNIPLFADDERAVIGTLYQKQGREPAMLKGLDIALPKVFSYVDTLKKLVKGKKVAVYCWRGGMRSELMSEVFSKAGYTVARLEGGYKAYRRFIREAFEAPANIMVLGGYTGCGKTEILGAMAELGEQVIDLEALASHKGSVFGALGQAPQPTNEQFENDLYSIWSERDVSRRLWLEDESRSIGRVALPPPVFEHISRSPMIEASLDRELRLDKLVAGYAGFDSELLAAALLRIHDGLGGARYKLAMKALDEKDFRLVADLVLDYYDKAYRKAIEKRTNKEIVAVGLKGADPAVHARAILRKLKNIKK